MTLPFRKPARSRASLAVAVPREPRRGVAVGDGHIAVAGARGRRAALARAPGKGGAVGGGRRDVAAGRTRISCSALVCSQPQLVT